MAPMKGSQNTKRLDGKVVAITGANTGIGFETARDLSRRGARVLILCRSAEKGRAAAEAISQETGHPVEVATLDLASLESVRQCATGLLEKEERLDLLVNNAGVMTCPEWKTADGFDMQLGTNHLGHFLLTELLLPLLRKSVEAGSHPRIVIVSSLAHTSGVMQWDDLHFEKGYSKMKAYSQSKLANVLHAKELSRRLENTGITVYVLHPGVVNTELARHIGNTWWGGLFQLYLKPFGKTPLQGAQTTLYCCLEDSIEKDSGKYYSDCKETRPHRRALDVEDQKRLWRISEELVGLREKDGKEG